MIWHDLRHALRAIARAPGFAAVVILTFALTIGANATVFSVVSAVLLQRLPYPASDRLVILDADARGRSRAGVADAEVIELKEEQSLFDQIARIHRVNAHLNVDGEMEQVAGASATDEALVILGVPLAHGRLLVAARDFGNDGFARSVIISHELWERRFSASRDAIGRHIEVNNLEMQIVGVLRPDFRVYLPSNSAVPERVDLWFSRPLETTRRGRGQSTIARLAPGVSLGEAQRRLDVLSSRFMTDHPADYADGPVRLYAEPLLQQLTADVGPALWALGGAVAFVLLIGCVNIGNLMLARARFRAAEMAVRHSLGGSRRRLIAQVFTETATLACAGGIAGLLLAHAGVAVIEWLRPMHLPRQSTIRVDWAVVAFTAVVSIAVSVVCSLLPALWHATPGANQSLRLGRAEVQRPGVRRLQRALVVAEVALCIIPLVGGGLMLRTFVNLLNAPLGFRPDQVLTAKVEYSFGVFATPESHLRLMTAAIERVAQLDGARGVSAGGPLPLDFPFIRTYGKAGDSEPFASQASLQSVFPGYLSITGVELKAGRDFTIDDLVHERRVAIVDERIAKQLWPDGALGQRLLIGLGRQPFAFEVIGVSNPVRAIQVRDTSTPHVFVPYDQFGLIMSLVIKTDRDVAAIGPAIKRAVESLGTRRPVYDITPMRTYVDRSIADARFTTLIVAAFGVAALSLAGIGIFGTLTYLAAQRRQEFAVRMALGASARRVLATVVGEGLLLTGVGAVAGFAGAIAVGSLLDNLLYDVTTLDWPTLGAVAVTVVAIALIGTALPAQRAARTDPAAALRSE